MRTPLSAAAVLLLLGCVTAVPTAANMVSASSVGTPAPVPTPVTMVPTVNRRETEPVDNATHFAPAKVPGYACPIDCEYRRNCHCASSLTPGGLAPSDVPQFVVLTNDDAVTITTQPVILDITNQHTNPNGCKIPATWFVSVNYTDYHLVQEAYMLGHEIATHTVNHVADPDIMEIVGAKLWLNQTAHVPLEKIKGFRAPFLIHDNDQRNMLQQNGFVYDSSIPEQFPTATSPDGSHRLWPYTMDYGLPQRCDLGTGPCSVNESHPGLWEFPMWDIQDSTGRVESNMDPQGDLYEAYKQEFDRNYNGNRAPLGVYIHAAWLMNPTRNAAMHSFIQYALSKPDVWFVTPTDVLDWIKNPVPASQYRRDCPVPTDMWFPSGHFCKAVRCVNGNWSDVTCECTCAAEFLPNQPGFCLDPNTQACTVPKLFDSGIKKFYCPGGQRTPAVAPTPPVEQPSDAQSCGHPLLDFNGLAMSGTSDPAVSYTQALKAVDGLCDTCAVADDTQGNFLMIALPQSTTITGIFVVAGQNLAGAFVFVGDSPEKNGLTNSVCASKVDVPALTPAVIECPAVGQYITIAVPGSLNLCDVWIKTPDSDQQSVVDLQSGGAVGPAAALGQLLGGKLSTLAGLSGSEAASAVAAVSTSKGGGAGGAGELNSFGIASADAPKVYGAEGQAMKLEEQKLEKAAAAPKAQ